MLATPNGSIPAQNRLWSEAKGAYRFFNCDDVTFKNVAEQHWQQTRKTKPGRYLLICDTTDIDHYSHQATTGLGILGDGQGRGMQLHSCLMFDSNEQQIVGTAGALINYRKHKPKNETRSKRLSRVRESGVWETSSTWWDLRLKAVNGYMFGIEEVTILKRCVILRWSAMIG